MNPIAEVTANGRRPTWWANRFANRVLAPLHQRVLDTAGLDFFGEDWDTLVILDACRADLFEETIDVTQFDTYRRVRSPGSATVEWCQKTLAGRAFTDTVYLTSNPSVTKHAGAPFAVYEDLSSDHFDRELGTVPAEPLTEAALEARATHPEKRLVVHYMQPHYPFVTDPEMRYTQFDWGEGDPPEAADRHDYDDVSDVWEALGLGLLSREEAWAGYRRNLEYVFEDVQRLLDGLEGRTVITSDHGNILGERSATVPIPIYGHPPGIVHETLRNVPWAVVEGERDDGSDTESDVNIEDRLEALGYR